MLYDSSINDARSFLVDLINDKKTSDQVAQLSYKIIFRIFLARNSVEDALVLLRLLQSHPEHAQKIDLRPEIRALPALEGHTKLHGSDEAKMDFPFTELSQIQLLGNKHEDMKPKQTDAFCADNTHFYHFNSDKGLYKISTSDPSKMPGLICHSNAEVKWGINARMLFYNNRIYVRSFDDKSKPFFVIDPDTLEVDKEFKDPTFEDAPCSLGKFQEEAVGGRTLKQSPFFTDGNYFYVVSQKKETSEDGDEITQLVVESYNPNDSYKFVRSFILYKNQEKSLFVKDGNSLDFIMNATWYTNGKYLVISKGQKEYFFDMTDGVKILSQNSAHDKLNLIHNYLSDTFIVFVDEKAITGTIKNFKAYNITDSTDLSKTASEVFAKYKDRYVGALEPPKALNVVQRIMRKKEGVQAAPAEAEAVPANSASLI